MAHIIELIGKIGSTATNSQSIEPARAASTTPAIHATTPHTTPVASSSAAMSPVSPAPDVSPPATAWKASTASRLIAEKAIVLRRVTKGAGVGCDGRWLAMAAPEHVGCDSTVAKVARHENNEDCR